MILLEVGVPLAVNAMHQGGHVEVQTFLSISFRLMLVGQYPKGNLSVC